jgi:hypothetical protein
MPDYRKGLALRERLVKAFPDDEDHRSVLVNSHVNLATLYATTGRSAEAEPYLDAASTIAEQLLAAHPDQPRARGAGGVGPCGAAERARRPPPGTIVALTGVPRLSRSTPRRGPPAGSRPSRLRPVGGARGGGSVDEPRRSFASSGGRGRA